MPWAPDAGDIVWLDFDPQVGREQASRRPAIVLSPRSYNLKSGLVIACPITTKSKGYPFEVVLPSGCKTKGVILADHIKSLDWQGRNITYIEPGPAEAIDETLDKLFGLIDPD